MKVRIGWLRGGAPGDLCLVSGKIYDALQLLPETRYCLHLGQWRKDITIGRVAVDGECVFLNEALLRSEWDGKDADYITNLEVNIWKEGCNLHLGPVIGIFLNPKRLHVPDRLNPLHKHMEAGYARNFLCYNFSLQDIDWEKKRIKGFTWIPEEDKWIYAWLPMPDVIYDRGARFSEGQKAAVKELRARFRRDFNIPFINSRDYIGKWKAYQVLANNNATAKYLPWTIRYEGFRNVEKMLKQYGLVFLKSYYGSRGRQVMSIEDQGGVYRIIHYAGKLQEIILKNSDELKECIEDFTAGKKFIVQQGIRLLEYKGRPFDMRVLIMKDGKGDWRVISNYARIARPGLTITNYSAGGECNFYTNIYPDLQCKGSVPSYADVAGAALEIASVLDGQLGPFGELGLDLAIDEGGAIWFIEANTKPDKDLVVGLDKIDGIHSQYLSIFEYAGYLCGLKG